MFTSRRQRRLAALLAVTSLAAGFTACNTRFGASLDRSQDPVVLTGKDLPKLEGTAPQHVVGFSWDGKAWHQIPVQVDERDLVNPGQIYNRPTSRYPTLYGTSTPMKFLVYTPPPTVTAGYTSAPTYTPSDSDPTLDDNDEVSFLAYDSGLEAGSTVAAPANVDASTREQLTATDPLNPTHVGYVTLFHSDTLTGGSAGTTGVHYTFSLDSGDYKSTYKMGAMSSAPNNPWGTNPEHSSVVTPSYTQTMSDRWLNDGLSARGASGYPSNLIDRSKYYVTNLGCVRTENTFDGTDNGEGAFIVNISGPVRAIRSSIGANSYVWTAITDVFYPNRQDTTVDLRGHTGLPGFAMTTDMATGLTGATYSDALNSNLPIDGSPDVFNPTTSTSGSGTTPPSWQLVNSPGVSLVTTMHLDTDISGLTESSVYTDQSHPSPSPCTGDGAYWGESGYAVNYNLGGGVPVTDPTLTATPATFVSHRTRYIEPSGFTAANAAQLETQVDHPISVAVGG